MKKLGLFLMGLLLVFGVSSTALAIPILQVGPAYMKFDNVEQIDPSGTMLSPSGIAESNWGVFEMSSIATGNITYSPQNFPPDTQYWSQVAGPGEITGIFGGIKLSAVAPVVPGTFESTGGSIYLYLDDTPDASLGSALPTDRTGDFAFNNFTDGSLLAKLDFVPGAVTANPLTTIVGTMIPAAGGIFGNASSYANVADMNGDGIIDINDGLWAAGLNGNYFTTLLGPNTADLMFRNVYQADATGHYWDDFTGNNPIFGADSSDPARAYVVPEPATMLLLGSGLLGLAGFGRKRKFFKKD